MKEKYNSKVLPKFKGCVVRTAYCSLNQLDEFISCGHIMTLQKSRVNDFTTYIVIRND